MKQILLVFILFLSACSINEVEKKEYEIQLDTSDSLSGIDENDNGIRDDIENWINQKWAKEPKKQKALLQYAKVNQLQVTVNLEDKEAISKIDGLETRAIDCLWRRFNATDENSEEYPSNIGKLIDSYTTNTPKRREHYLEFNSRLDGTVPRPKEEDTCDK